jgi:hypothetical protein
MRFGYDHDMSHLTAAEQLLRQSVEDFKQLTELTETTYRTAAGMQTSQRQIPVRGGPATNHWRDLLPVYQKELAVFDRRLQTLKSAGADAADSSTQSAVARLVQVDFSLAPGAGEAFTVAPGQKLYTDLAAPIQTVASELNGMTGIRVSSQQSEPIHFTLEKPAQILVGFFKSNSSHSMNVSPDTEQWNLLLPNAVVPSKGLPISVWAKPLPAGKNDLDLGKGAYVVLGFIPEATHVVPHITSATGQPANLDWLFED